MATIRTAAITLLAFVAASCSSMQGPATSEVRHAMAPTGKLRVALFNGNAVHVVKDPATGEMKGVGHDLGRELASRLGVPFEPRLYSAAGAIFDDGKAGAWDVAFVGISPERATYLDFTATHLEVDFGYLVPAGSPIVAMDQVDRAGIRVAVVARGSPDIHLTRTLKSATLVRAPGQPQAVELLKSGQADVLGGVKAAMLDISGRLPGSRVLDGRPGSEDAALAMPKGRGAAAQAYARRFIEDVKAGGQVKAAMERAGVRGAAVAPAQ